MEDPQLLADYLEDEYMDLLYDRWKKAQKRFTDTELLEMFPDVKADLPKEIAAQEQGLKALRREMADAILNLAAQKLPDFEHWIRKELLMRKFGDRLRNRERNLATLRRLDMISRGQKIVGWITDDQIYTAQQTPIQALISMELKRSGKTFRGLCPFHDEKSPSFYIYPDTNSCWCFGCQQGGDSIKFVMLMHGLSFKQAVRHILEGKQL